MKREVVSDFSVTWGDLIPGADFQGRTDPDFDSRVEHYLWGADPDEEVTLKTTRRSALFYSLLAQGFMRYGAPEGGSPNSVYQQLHRLSYVLSFAAWHGLSDDTKNVGWAGPPSAKPPA